MAYGNAQRAWTYAEYVKEYEQLQAKNDKLVAIKQIAYEAICTGDQEAEDKAIGLIEDFDKAALAEAEK